MTAIKKAEAAKSSAAPATPMFVIAARGDGAFAKVVSADKLHQEIHDAMCCCEASWENCSTEGVTADVRRLDDDDSWTHCYPNYFRGEMDYDFEDGGIRVTQLSEPVTTPAHQALYEALSVLPLDSFGDDMSKHDAAEFVDHAGEFFEAMVKARAALALADAAQGEK